MNWTTPSASDGDRGGRMTPAMTGSSLTQQVGSWPTPTAQDCEQSGGAMCTATGRRGQSLWHAATAEWPTPASRDFRTPNSQESQARRQHSGGEQLPNFVEHHFSHPVLSTLDGRPLSPAGRTLPRRLNPAFACWLMGWPIWWTNPALTSSVRSEMALYRCRLQQHLCSFFGEPARLEGLKSVTSVSNSKDSAAAPLRAPEQQTGGIA